MIQLKHDAETDKILKSKLAEKPIIIKIRYRDFLFKKRFTFALLARGIYQMTFAYLLPIIPLLYQFLGMTLVEINLSIAGAIICYMAIYPGVY